ncbi:hypothetical protein [Pseudalkalibacillus caeni]|uniref:Uncharacterized protein n=1 Tax=Exobacillus caeni TaxID=2574798 RepID=A0A5R9F093_9BACL|nr:hypothetical protein [Pseudalkalibacillus caeni]TLS35830.1 hypothetical protein FCL54_18615 [Pseudalkalibacillus caeni]
MKNVIACLAAALMLTTAVNPALAVGDNTNQNVEVNQGQQKQMAKKRGYLHSHKHFKEMWELHREIDAKQDLLVELMVEVEVTQKKQLAETNKKLKEINSNLETKTTELREKHRALKQQWRDGSEEEAKQGFEQLAKENEKVLELLREKNNLLQQMIDQLEKK